MVLKSPEVMRYRVASIQGKGTREKQEDAYFISEVLDDGVIGEKGLLIVVADGMGGMTDGKVASDTVVKEVQQAYLDFDLNKSLPRQLIQVLYRANDAVWNKLRGNGGSTAVLGYIINDHLYFSSVGDSYIWILHDRIITRMNRSHNDLNKRRQECFSKGEIFLSNMTFTNGPKALTNFIGMPQLLGTDTLLQPLHLEPGDTILLCSDGILDALQEKELEDLLSLRSPEEMCEDIVNRIHEKNLQDQDNYTAIIVQCFC